MSRSSTYASSAAFVLLVTASNIGFSQSCTTPTLLNLSGSFQIDTCAFGPNLGSNFDPAIFVRRHDQTCNGSGSCVMALDTATTGQSELFRLYTLDSGDYDIIATSTNPDAPCGSATVTFAEDTFGELPPSDGLFISKFEF
jgi:hypothetical protein